MDQNEYERLSAHATPKQKQVVDLLFEGLTQAGVAVVLGLNIRTVERRLAAVRKKALGGPVSVSPGRTITAPALHIPKRVKPRGEPTEHLWIPDTQVRPGVPTEHILGAIEYACEKRPDVIILGGDHWDMPSLNSYEKPGSKYYEGRRLHEDFDSGNEVMAAMEKRLDAEKMYNPRLVFLEGNHEYRLQRLLQAEPVRTEGLFGRENFYAPGWEWNNFLDIVTIDGIMYSHYFVNPQSAIRGVLGGAIDNRLNKLKASFTQGHQQTLLWGGQDLPGGRRILGLVAGAFYQHDEEYMGPQGNNHWRGLVYKHEVRDGEYDPMMVSLDYILRKYT